MVSQLEISTIPPVYCHIKKNYIKLNKVPQNIFLKNEKKKTKQSVINSNQKIESTVPNQY